MATGAYMRPIFDELHLRLLLSAKKWTHYPFDGSVDIPLPTLQFICATLQRNPDISDATSRGVEVVLLSFFWRDFGR